MKHIIFIIICVSLVSLCGCSIFSTNNFPLTKNQSCEEWARSVFPNEWKFQKSGLYAGGIFYFDDFTPITPNFVSWDDGVKLDYKWTTLEQRLNRTDYQFYYYTQPFLPEFSETYGFSYSYKSIDSQGIALENRSFMVRPVFRLRSTSTSFVMDEFGAPTKMKYFSFLLTEPNFIYCNKSP